MMKRFWASALKVLEEVARLCERRNIPWFVEFGTLLGAVREKGFIAWDDDIDISMMRKDFERFVYYAKTDLPEGWFCINERGDVQDALICRVVNSRGIRTDQAFLDEFYGCPYINGVDVFVYDEIPEEQGAFDQYVNLVHSAWALAQHISGNFEDVDEEVKELIVQLEDLSGVKLDRSRGMKSQLLTLAEQISAMYMGEGGNRIAIASKLLEKKKYVFQKEWFAYRDTAVFEGLEVPVPRDYDKVLRVWYGDDYMTPVQGMAGHDYPGYAEQERILFETYEKRGMQLPESFRE
ncbi:MAG: LicD family protein [Lachnospiraceae bacterium]|nr:LicD family protein [Lachnospiraceae bacterium]